MALAQVTLTSPQMFMTGHGAGQLEMHSVNCRNLLPNILRVQIAGGFIAAAPIIIAFVVLTVATPAFAQSSLDSSSAPATDYALPPPEGSLIEPAPRDDATSKNATPDGATPRTATSSAAVPTTPSAAVKPFTATDHGADASAAAHSGWDRVKDVYTDTDSEDRADKVLEVPQMLSPANPQPSDDADQTAQEDDSQASDQTPTTDQVGSIENYEDYQDEVDDALIGGYGYPVFLGSGINHFGVSAFRTPVNRGFRPVFQPGFVPTVPRIGGGMNSAILPTSPMFPSGGSARFSGGGTRFSGFSGGMRFSGGGRR
jgi:hypothetical protein